MFETSEKQESELAPDPIDQTDDIADVLDFEPSDEKLDDFEPEGEESEVPVVEEEVEEVEVAEIEGDEVEASSEVEEPEDVPMETPEEPSEPEVPAESSELAELKAQLATLQALVQAQQTPPEEAPAPETEEMDFSKVFENLDFDAVVDTKEGFVEFMTNVLKTMHEQTVNSVVNVVPQTIHQTTQRQEAMSQIRTAFYEDYPELAPVKGYVGQLANEISAQNPGMELQEVLVKTAEAARQNLNLSAAQAVPKPEVKGNKPSLPGASTPRKPQPVKNKVQSEIDEILDL